MDRRVWAVVALVVATASAWSHPAPALRAAASGADTVTIKGRFVRTVTDPPGAQHTQHWLETGDDPYRLELEEATTAEPGQRVMVHGTLSGTRIDATSVVPIGPEPEHAITGLRDLLFVLVTWTEPDGLHRWEAREQLQQVDVPWYQEVSYGRMTLAPTVTPWLQISGPAACDTGAIASAADAAAAQAGYDTSAFDHTMIYFPWFEECNWAGMAEVPGNTTWINGSFQPRVTVHELGHNFGLLHSSDWVCHDGSGNLVTLSADCAVSNWYGDPFSAMGHGRNGVAHFAPSQKKYLGWMHGRVRRIRHDAEVVLAPLERTTPEAPQALRIDAPFARYWIDYRQPIGVDDWMSTTTTDGVLVHINGRDDTYLLDMRTADQWHEDAALPEDTPFTDPGGVTIEAREGTRAGVTVEVTGLPTGRARWAQYKVGPGHTGNQQAETAIGPGNVASLERAWAVRYRRHIVGPPVLHDGVLSFLHRDDADVAQEMTRVRGVAASTGEHVWYSRVCNLPRWPLAVAKHSALFPGTTGCAPAAVSAIDLRVNGTRWSLEPAGPVVVGHGIAYGPIPTGSGTAALRAFTAGSGRVRWTTPTGVGWDATRRSTPSVSNGIVFLAEGRNSPVVAGDRVFATAPVHAFDAATGSELWRSACEPDVRLCSLNAATGAVIWSARIDDRLRLGEPAVDARTVVTTCGDGLCAFDRGTGERVWRTPDELGCDRAHGTGCHPIIANGVVYAPSADGLIRTYSVRLGAPLARFQVGARPTVIVADGTMFTTTGRGVRAYRLPTAEG